jgi:hypothetical protein
MSLLISDPERAARIRCRGYFVAAVPGESVCKRFEIFNVSLVRRVKRVEKKI